MTYEDLERRAVDISFEMSRYGELANRITFHLNPAEYLHTVTEVLKSGKVGLLNTVGTSKTLRFDLSNGLKVLLLSESTIPLDISYLESLLPGIKIEAE